MTTDWQRGFQAGLQSAREMIDGAQSTLQREREDQRRWQAMMTDALAQAEAQTLKDEALLRQALEALESFDWYIGQLERIVYSPDDTGTHDARAKVQSAIAALRERLGVSNG